MESKKYVDLFADALHLPFKSETIGEVLIMEVLDQTSNFISVRL